MGIDTEAYTDVGQDTDVGGYIDSGVDTDSGESIYKEEDSDGRPTTDEETDTPKRTVVVSVYDKDGNKTTESVDVTDKPRSAFGWAAVFEKEAPELEGMEFYYDRRGTVFVFAAEELKLDVVQQLNQLYMLKPQSRVNRKRDSLPDTRLLIDEQ